MVEACFNSDCVSGSTFDVLTHKCSTNSVKNTSGQVENNSTFSAVANFVNNSNPLFTCSRSTVCLSEAKMYESNVRVIGNDSFFKDSVLAFLGLSC